jgi:3-oxoacyl-[acyl-carrier-protein] synthase-3
VAVGILGIGSHVPDGIIGNATISEWTNTSPQWIVERTGILERRYADRGTTTSALGHAAVGDLVGRHPDALTDLGAVIVATSTPDQPQPATAAILQRELGLSGVAAFDLNAVCSGFVYALTVGSALVGQPGWAPRVLVVAADLYSSIMDRTDRKTVSLFGDGAGAVLLGRVPDGFGLHASRLTAHGEHRELVEVVGGGTRRRLDADALAAGDDRFRMRGRDVRDYALRTLPEIVHDVLDDAGLGLDDIDRFVFHQANPKLLEDLAKALGIDLGRIPLTAPRYGNTGSASIPITLCHSHREQPLRRGERVLFAAVGGGMTAGAAVLTWY